MYDYIKTGRAKSDLAKRIDAAVGKARKNEVWRAEYMKERIILSEAREEGREEGREEERKNTERERKRADEAEARVKELEAMLTSK